MFVPVVPACLLSQGLISCPGSAVSRLEVEAVKSLTSFSPHPQRSHIQPTEEHQGKACEEKLNSNNLHQLRANTPYSLEQGWHPSGSSPVIPLPPLSMGLPSTELKLNLRILLNTLASCNQSIKEDSKLKPTHLTSAQKPTSALMSLAERNGHSHV